MQPKCGELGTEQRRPLWQSLAQGQHQPVGGSVQDQAELIGARIPAGRAIGGELRLVELDEILRFAAGAVDGIARKAASARWGK